LGRCGHAMIFRQQTVHIHTSRPDGNGILPPGVGSRNVERIRGCSRVSGAAKNVQRFGASAAREFREPLVPVGIQLDSPLLHYYPVIIIPGVKREPAVIEGQGSLLSILVNHPKFHSDRKIFLHPYAEIGLPQWREQKVEGTHFSRVIRTASYSVVRGGQKFCVTWLSIAEGEEQWLRRIRALLTLLYAFEASWRHRTNGQVAEADAALLFAVRNQWSAPTIARSQLRPEDAVRDQGHQGSVNFANHRATFQGQSTAAAVPVEGRVAHVGATGGVENAAGRNHRDKLARSDSTQNGFVDRHLRSSRFGNQARLRAKLWRTLRRD